MAMRERESELDQKLVEIVFSDLGDKTSVIDVPISLPSMVISKKTLFVIFGPFFSSSAKVAGMAKRPKIATAKRMRFIISIPVVSGT